MKTIHQTFNVYPFEELSEPSKEKALEEEANVNVRHQWWSEDDAILDIAEAYGLKIVLEDICFDLGRGNFLYFETHNHGSKKNYEKGIVVSDYKKFQQQAGIDTKEELDFTIDHKHFGGGAGRNIITAGDMTEKQEKELQKTLNRFVEEALHLLKTNYDYLTSEKAIIETIKINDWHFLKDGSFYGGAPEEEKLTDWNELNRILLELEKNRSDEISRHAKGLLKALKL